MAAESIPVLDPLQITTVIFDLDDTLRESEPRANEMVDLFLRTQGLELDWPRRRAAQLWEHQYWANSPELLADENRLGDDSPAFWSHYSKLHLLALGLGTAQAESLGPRLRSYMQTNYRPRNLLRPHTLETLAQLRASGLTLGVLTNRSRTVYHEMHTLGLDLFMDAFLTAGQLGAYKPEKQAFLNMLDFIQRRPEEVVYVGDNYYADVLGPHAAGIPAVLVNTKGLYEPGAPYPVIEYLNELVPLLQREAAG